jgi:hypothetical protein
MDVKWAGMRVSCDQDIAGDGFFSLGMIARFEPALQERANGSIGVLFWECGLIGQVLYLDAEAAGGRATASGASMTMLSTRYSDSKDGSGSRSITSRWACLSRTRGSRASQGTPSIFDLSA